MNDQMRDTSSGEPRSDINCMNDQMKDTSSGEPRSDINPELVSLIWSFIQFMFNQDFEQKYLFMSH
jgi:hypothetical protein